MGAAAISDRRLKTNIRKVGKLINGISIYLYDYIWGQPSMGAMADEVKKLIPEAVVNIGGYDHVNYARIL